MTQLIDIVTTEWTWFRDAACRDGDASLVDLFFSEHLEDIARAKALCGMCSVRAACLEAAMEREEPWGVWGGELLVNGSVTAHKRVPGRPPKVRPEYAFEDPLVGLLPVSA